MNNPFSPLPSVALWPVLRSFPALRSFSEGGSEVGNGVGSYAPRTGFKIFLCLSALLIATASLAMEPDRGEKLLAATSIGNLEHVQALLDAGVPVDVKNSFGSTPLIVAASWGDEELCQLLIERKAQLDVKNSDGKTALMEAADLWEHKKACRLLVDAQMKQYKAALVALLGIKKFHKAACMKPIDFHVIQIIAGHAFHGEKQMFLAQINGMKREKMKKYCLAYACQ